MERCFPCVPIHELFGYPMGIISHRLTAHRTFDVAVVGQFEIDVDRHILNVPPNFGFMPQDVPRTFLAAW